jgi:hypothetical protein
MVSEEMLMILPWPLLLHGRDDGFTAQPEALDVDCHHPIPLRFRDLLKRGEG